MGIVLECTLSNKGETCTAVCYAFLGIGRSKDQQYTPYYLRSDSPTVKKKWNLLSTHDDAPVVQAKAAGYHVREVGRSSYGQDPRKILEPFFRLAPAYGLFWNDGHTFAIDVISDKEHRFIDNNLGVYLSNDKEATIKLIKSWASYYVLEEKCSQLKGYMVLSDKPVNGNQAQVQIIQMPKIAAPSKRQKKKRVVPAPPPKKGSIPLSNKRGLPYPNPGHWNNNNNNNNNNPLNNNNGNFPLNNGNYLPDYGNIPLSNKRGLPLPNNDNDDDSSNKKHKFSKALKPHISK